MNCVSHIEPHQRMKQDARRRIYQTKVSITPWYGSGGTRYQSLIDEGALGGHPS